ncbi:MarR family transcriptional regulator [Actinacidiphila alni]|uniref:MarR family winged helix-turn-helix transcriptional regulator n=1 Tax=Actinacidiphila alni TaxID=380248 RepID=UPI0033C3BCFD
MDRTREAAAEREFTLLLDDQLCFALYAASRAVTSRYRPLLDDLGLTYPQYLVMLVLWQHGAVPIKDVGAALQLDYGTLTPLIKRLEAAGLVRRERSARDERTVHVSLTEEGDRLRDRARDVPPAIGAAMSLSPEETEAAMTLLRRLADNVSADLARHA